jgi:hypothetical protein
MDRTIKVRALTPGAPAGTGNLSREQELGLEIAKKSKLLEEEIKKSQETLQALEQAREALKQEQAKSGQLQEKLDAARAKIKTLVGTLEKIYVIASDSAINERD